MEGEEEWKRVRVRGIEKGEERRVSKWWSIKKESIIFVKMVFI